MSINKIKNRNSNHTFNVILNIYEPKWPKRKLAFAITIKLNPSSIQPGGDFSSVAEVKVQQT